MICKLFIIVFISFITLSCSRGEKKSPLNSNVSEYDEVLYDKSTGFNAYKNTELICVENFPEPIKLNRIEGECFVSVLEPSKIIVYDNFFIVLSRRSPRATVFNKNELFEFEFLNSGRGPGEILSLENVDLSPKERHITFTDSQQNKILKYSIDSIENRLCKNFSLNRNIELPILNPVKEINLDRGNNIQSTFMKNDSIITFSKNRDDNKIFAYYNIAGNIIGCKGEYPEYPEGLSTVQKRFAFTASFIANDDRTKMALFYDNTDMFEIYNIDGELIKRVWGPNYFHVVLNYTEQKSFNAIANSAGPILNKTRMAYNRAVVKDDLVWVKYSGKYVKMDVEGSNHIFVFDWDGNMVRRFIYDDMIACFDVDTKLKMIYAIIIEDNYFKIVKYSYE